MLKRFTRPLHALSPAEREEAVTEVTLLSTLRHPNVISYYHHFVSENLVHIVMECVPPLPDTRHKLRGRQLPGGELHTPLCRVAVTGAGMPQAVVWTKYWKHFRLRLLTTLCVWRANPLLCILSSP